MLFALQSPSGRQFATGVLIKDIGDLRGVPCSAVLCPVIADVGGQLVRVSDVSGTPVSAMTLAVPSAHLRPAKSSSPSPFTLALMNQFDHSSLLPLVENPDHFQSPCSESAPEIENLDSDQMKLQLAQQAEQIKARNSSEASLPLLPRHALPNRPGGRRSVPMWTVAWTRGKTAGHPLPPSSMTSAMKRR